MYSELALYGPEKEFCEGLAPATPNTLDPKGE